MIYSVFVERIIAVEKPLGLRKTTFLFSSPFTFFFILDVILNNVSSLLSSFIIRLTLLGICLLPSISIRFPLRSTPRFPIILFQARLTSQLSKRITMLVQTVESNHSNANQLQVTSNSSAERNSKPAPPKLL